jgi:hypothetical protein
LKILTNPLEFNGHMKLKYEYIKLKKNLSLRKQLQI